MSQVIPEYKKGCSYNILFNIKNTAEWFKLTNHTFSVKFFILKSKNGHFIFVHFLKVIQEVSRKHIVNFLIFFL